MKIKYIHFSEPEKVKEYDTEKAYKNNPFLRMSQDEFNKRELRSFERRKAEGIILKFDVTL